MAQELWPTEPREAWAGGIVAPFFTFGGGGRFKPPSPQTAWPVTPAESRAPDSATPAGPLKYFYTGLGAGRSLSEHHAPVIQTGRGGSEKRKLPST